MPENVQTTQVGAAAVTVINVYDIPTKLENLLVAPVSERTPGDTAQFAQITPLPVNCILVQSGGLNVLVDAGAYEAEFDEAKRPDYQPPMDLLSALAGRGVQPTDVTHVVITHTHGDHFNAATTQVAGGYLPTFPNARYYVGRADWESTRMQEAAEKAGTLENRTLAVINRLGRLVPVEGDLALGSGVNILASPGETPGHQSLRVRSEGQTLYCLGDLYHHAVEVDHPTCASPGATRRASSPAGRPWWRLPWPRTRSWSLPTSMASVGCNAPRPASLGNQCPEQSPATGRRGSQPG